MPVTLAPISAELFADFRGGKETALEQLFRANFEPLTKEAAERLEDVATAQKVVAGAFIELWDRRAKFDTAAVLEAKLHEAVAGGATHEVRRRASAHHMSHGDTSHAAHVAQPETTDQWWTKVAGVLHAAHADPAEAARQRAEHSRHEAAAHMKKVAQPKRTGRYAVIVVLLAIAAGVPLWYFSKGAEGTKAGQMLGRDDAKVMSSKNGQRGEVMLEDSTLVKIGASTVVKYPAHYPLDARALLVVGTAVIKAPKYSPPLMVKVGTFWITASDAEFIARSYADDSGTVMLKCLKGSVSVMANTVEKTLAAGSMLQILSNGTFMELVPEKASFAFGWADGNFVSEHQPMRKVLTELKRWYTLEVVVKDSSYLDRPVLMTASLDSTEAAIAAFEEGGAVSIAFDGGRRVLKDMANAPKKPAKQAAKKPAKKGR